MAGSDAVDVLVRGLSRSSDGKVMVDFDVLSGGRIGLVGAMMLLMLSQCTSVEEL